MSKLQPVRGTHDILPDEMRVRRRLIETARGIAECYGFGEVQTPVFEFTDVFHRTLGDTSDVVTKETYSFTDRGGESLTLRPEFTAACVRAMLSGGLTQELPLKWFYAGPAFRYERPQKGRMRQFHQIGVEVLGAPEPLADIETIALAAQILDALGLSAHVTLELNSLGDAPSRAAYRAALVEYLSDHRADLSEDSRTRLEKNPLRVLDSKDEGDRKIVAGAPLMQAHFGAEAAAFFARVRAGLEGLSIAYTVNPKLVRGLDYYSHTVFEFTTAQLGAQGTVLAGGRYDGLVKLMGGPDMPGVGFAAGVERLLALYEQVGGTAEPEAAPVAVIPMGEAQEAEALILVQRLRHSGIRAELITRGNMGKRMKRADKLGSSVALILGEEELAAGVVAWKELATGEQRRVRLTEVAQTLSNL